MTLALSETLMAWKSTLDARLNLMVESAWQQHLYAACRKGVAHGKRLRPLMLMALVEGWGGSPLSSIDAACAIELVHLANMIIECLPCQGSAQRVRRNPPLYEEFDEATAIAVAQTFFAKAFEIICTQELLHPSQMLSQVRLLSFAIGARGSAGSLICARQPPHVLNHAHGDWSFHKMHSGALFHAVLETAAGITNQSLSKTNRAAELGEQLGIVCSLLDEIHHDIQKEHNKNSLSSTLRRAQALHLLQLLRQEFKEALRYPETVLQLIDYVQRSLTDDMAKQDAK